MNISSYWSSIKQKTYDHLNYYQQQPKVIKEDIHTKVWTAAISSGVLGLCLAPAWTPVVISVASLATFAYLTSPSPIKKEPATLIAQLPALVKEQEKEKLKPLCIHRWQMSQLVENKKDTFKEEVNTIEIRSLMDQVKTLEKQLNTNPSAQVFLETTDCPLKEENAHYKNLLADEQQKNSELEKENEFLEEELITFQEQNKLLTSQVQSQKIQLQQIKEEPSVLSVSKVPLSHSLKRIKSENLEDIEEAFKELSETHTKLKDNYARLTHTCHQKQEEIIQQEKNILDLEEENAKLWQELEKKNKILAYSAKPHLFSSSFESLSISA